MPRLDEDLCQLIKKNARIQHSHNMQQLKIISQIAIGMAYLHDKEIFHGDLKASNVLVTHHGARIQTKITNFGVSQSMQFSQQCERRMNGNDHQVCLALECTLHHHSSKQLGHLIQWHMLCFFSKCAYDSNMFSISFKENF